MGWREWLLETFWYKTTHHAGTCEFTIMVQTFPGGPLKTDQDEASRVSWSGSRFTVNRRVGAALVLVEHERNSVWAGVEVSVVETLCSLLLILERRLSGPCWRSMLQGAVVKEPLSRHVQPWFGYSLALDKPCLYLYLFPTFKTRDFTLVSPLHSTQWELPLLPSPPPPYFPSLFLPLTSSISSFWISFPLLSLTHS